MPRAGVTTPKGKADATPAELRRIRQLAESLGWAGDFDANLSRLAMKTWGLNNDPDAYDATPAQRRAARTLSGLIERISQ